MSVILKQEKNGAVSRCGEGETQSRTHFPSRGDRGYEFEGTQQWESVRKTTGEVESAYVQRDHSEFLSEEESVSV